MRPENLKESMANLLANINIAHLEMASSIEEMRRTNDVPERAVSHEFLSNAEIISPAPKKLSRKPTSS